MIKLHKIQKGKGKRIKLQWQYRLLEAIRIIHNIPNYLKRQWKWLCVTVERKNIHRTVQEEQNKIFYTEAIARADAIMNDMFFNLRLYD